MTPQSTFLYAAAVVPERRDDLRSLLLSMNRSEGEVNPQNAILPFAQLTQLHFARLLVVTDLAASDRALFGLPTTGLPDYLVFLGEIDGEEETFRAQLVQKATPGLLQLFSHCEPAPQPEELGRFLASSRVNSSATYVNWRGRTVVQEGQEEQLRRALETYVQQNRNVLVAMRPQQIRDALKQHVETMRASGSLTLTPEAPTPAAWRVRNLLHLIGVPIVLLLATPLLLLLLPVYLIALRRWERNDAAIAPAVDPAHAAQLAALENHDVLNQFSVFGSLKPGKLRLWSVRFFLWIVDYTARHIYNRGGLARVSTIHFARWVPFDGGQRMLFSSIYDGSLESYMDDFINKVGFGLNITFSNGIGYPRTRWLVLDGCRDEQVFKRVLRRHQLPTEVWYNANPGLTAANKHTNGLIRKGLERVSMSDDEIREWLTLL